MKFKCTNEKELLSKGLTLLGDIDIDVTEEELSVLKTGEVIIFDTINDTFHTFKPKGGIVTDIFWVITEQSYTDNLDNDTFTYFKYGI
jgi:hypothetical protein